MDKRMCCLFLVLQMTCLVCVKSRPLTVGIDEVGKTSVAIFERAKDEGEESKEVMSKIGSSPPRCEHKCYGCMPCEAIQVPANTGRVGVEYANYEPEGWKCKCGATFYSP